MLVDLKAAIEEAVGWLETAERIACVEFSECEGWKALGQTADQIGGVLVLARKLLPLHPELEAGVQAEWDRDDGYESPEAMGLTH